MKYLSLLLLIAPLVISNSVLAETDSIKELKQALAKTMPNVKPSKISKSPVDGLYEVVVGTQVVYMSVDAR